MPLAPGSCGPADTIRTLPWHRNAEEPLSDAGSWAEIPGQHLRGLSLEDASPPWSADAARPDVAISGDAPRTLSHLGTERIEGQCAALLKVTQEIPVDL
jgi:hypothetical protein